MASCDEAYVHVPMLGHPPGVSAPMAYEPAQPAYHPRTCVALPHRNGSLSSWHTLQVHTQYHQAPLTREDLHPRITCMYKYLWYNRVAPDCGSTDARYVASVSGNHQSACIPSVALPYQARMYIRRGKLFRSQVPCWSAAGEIPTYNVHVIRLVVFPVRRCACSLGPAANTTKYQAFCYTCTCSLAASGECHL